MEHYYKVEVALLEPSKINYTQRLWRRCLYNVISGLENLFISEAVPYRVNVTMEHH